MKDLKEKTIRGGFTRILAQAANFLLRIGSLTIVARLLGPKDFGLVGMVTAFTGVLGMFRDFGLSSAAVQRDTVTEGQISTLFWINVLVGAVLGLTAGVLAPAIAVFYHEPRLVAVTIVLAIGFLVNAAGVQHSAVLQRQMRFTALAVINIVALVASTVVAVGGAIAGYGYWSLVAMNVTLPLVSTVGCWVVAAWVPGLPRRGTGVLSMIRFGGTMTLTGFVVYVASNFEKALLGRFWGVDAIGLYGRAYQLISIPTDNLNSAAGEVAFSALSRLQNDPPRLKNYFLKGYSIIMALTLPLTTACALFADDVILAILGPKWKDAAAIFRLLAPTILVFAVANPLSWLVSSLGMVNRGLKMSMVIAPVMIGAYFIALPYGPRGVALAYSAVMVLWLVPVILWSIHGTVISPRDVLMAVSRPMLSSILAGVISFGVRILCAQSLPALSLLIVESSILLATYVGALLFVTGQKSFYLGLVRELAGRSAHKESALVSA